METKVGAVTFSHNSSFTGEVEIERGGLAVKVPFEALQKIVAEKVRFQMVENINALKPHEILALAASKK
jgi:autotransporter-associated beta strand protein